MRTSYAVLIVMFLALGPIPQAYAQKYGGTLQAMLETNPGSLSLLDESTIATNWCMMPVHNNLVLFHPLKAQESLDTIAPELATGWRWSEGGTVLTFALHEGVRFHDGRPMTSADVKHTFDVVRGASKFTTKLSPRKLWYANVADIATNGDREVTFRLKRPQPSLLVMLATGFSPVVPAHINPRDLRTTAVGTGPFKLKEYKAGQYVHVVKNPDYFVRGRPYLDAIRYNVIRNMSTARAALQAGQIDIDGVNQTTFASMEVLKSAQPALVFTYTDRTNVPSLLFNTHQPPFSDPRLRQAVSMGIDRQAFAKAVYKGGVLPGGVNLPPPLGAWGLPQDQLDALPGYGDIRKNQARAREIMAELGYSATKPLRVTVLTRNVPQTKEPAIWTVSNLKSVWIDAELQTIEGPELYSRLAAHRFHLVAWSQGIAADDPDVNFYETYGCGSQRNYTDYCKPEMQKLYDEQSQEPDLALRKQQVLEIDKRLITDVARVIYGFRANYNAMWPYVKNLVPHQTNYSYGRMQEVWLDK
ncbi:MAG: ABC transporter substrate-binding protein [Candidatus Lambdaproteobacteria bacterium]|nr:ABC transporter substrate-binding protein [Candidatus Lambdaproteobacteria bacterium]